MAIEAYNLGQLPRVHQWLIPLLLMLLVQAISVGINIFYKLATHHTAMPMPTSILIAYRFIFASITLAPFTLYKSRNNMHKLTWKLTSLTFVYGLLGGSLYHNLYTASSASTSATFVSAIVNLTPVITFILRVVLIRSEALIFRTLVGKAKIVGIILSTGGVMLLTFFHRLEINVWPTKFNLLSHDNHDIEELQNQTLGLILAMVAACSYACCLMIQEKFKQNPDQNIFLIPFLSNLMAAIQAVVYALCIERNWSHWKPGWNMSLWATSVAGVFGSGLITVMTTWCILKMDSVFVSAFNPVGLILRAILGSLLLGEKVYVTSMIAIALIIGATWLILWGKLREANNRIKLPETVSPAEDGEDSGV